MGIQQVIDTVGREKAIAILRTDNQARAAEAMSAVIRGGFRVLEFTMSIPGVYELIRDFSRNRDLTIGAGTVLTPEQARQSVEAGARFLVSPVVDESIVRLSGELGVASIPGTQTATEMLLAHRAGATFCKLFPAPPGGPGFISAMMGPMPFLKLVPTNGVTHQNAHSWLEAGAFGVGFVTPLFDPDMIATSNWEALEERARLCIEATRS